MKTILTTFVCFYFSLIANAQWAKSTFPSGFSHFEYVTIKDQNIVASSSGTNSVYYSIDGGRNFLIKNVTQYVNIGFQVLNDTSFYNLRYDGLYLSKNKGDNWSKIYIQNLSGDTLVKNSFTTFHIFPNGNGFVSCLPNYKTVLYITKDFGKTWMNVDSNKISIQLADKNGAINYPKVYAFDSTAYSIKLLTPNSLIVYLNYGDSAYDIDLSSIDSGIIKDIAFKDELNAMVLTSTNDIFITNDACKTFTKKTNPPINCQNLEFASQTNNRQSFYAISGRGGSSGMYYTQNNGQSWDMADDFYHYYTLDFFDAEIGVASVTENDKILYFSGLTGLKNEIKPVSDFNIHPNPNNGNFSIISSEPIHSYQIYDANGRQMFNSNVENTNTLVINLKLSNGLYFIKIASDKSVSTKRFIVDE